MLLLWVFLNVIAFSPVVLLSKTSSNKKCSNEFIPCEEGWFLFGEKCLKLRGQSWKTSQIRPWEGAESRCKEVGGNLVSIQSKEELDFIINFVLLDVSVGAWIGLRKQNNSKEFAWSDGSAVNYTYWDKGEPSNNENAECVAMRFDPGADIVGKWVNIPCSKWYGYICQKGINKRKKSHNPQFCTAEEGGGWKFQNTCYHIVKEMKTWYSAEQHCKDHYGGHLATILHKGVDLYLENLLSSINKYFWIGMQITDALEQKWASGWLVTYNRTSSDYEEVTDDTCVLRNNSTVWNTASCTEKHPFICDTFRGPPVLNPPVNGSHCPENPSDWIDLGGEYCYFFETGKPANWYQALYECKRRGGNLASIHSKEESELIEPFIKYVSSSGYYIGLLRQLGCEDVFVWSDGSPVDYENWSYWEPNSETEKCAEVWTQNMDWNDVWCSQERGYICSVKKVIRDDKETPEYMECNRSNTVEDIFEI